MLGKESALGVNVTLPGSQYVAGVWDSGTGAAIEVLNPVDEEVLATLPSCGEAEVEAALAAARDAQHEWARAGAIARGAHLRQLADLIRAHRSELAALLVAEVGKPLAQAEGEVDFAEALVPTAPSGTAASRAKSSPARAGARPSTCCAPRLAWWRRSAPGTSRWRCSAASWRRRC